MNNPNRPPLQPSPKSAFVPNAVVIHDVHSVTNSHPPTAMLVQLTHGLCNLYKKCSPERFRYSSSVNPRRALTKPSEGVANFRSDNVNADLVAYVGDPLGDEPARKFVIEDLLGSGTFGQVFKCTDVDNSSRTVAIKVVKNKQAYFNQGLVEVRLLEQLNGISDSGDSIVRLSDYFIYKRHLCLVFEMLSINLYELIKQNSHRGLNVGLVKHFTKQILEGLVILEKIHLIHCDVKPENILLVDSKSSQLKLIDFGSACFENQTVYTYIQSRFYRSPEVIVGTPYNSRIDMWSLGCVAAELLLGLPLFPGHSEYDQMCRIVEMMGSPPEAILLRGKSVGKYFLKTYDKTTGKYTFELKSLAQYSVDQGARQKPGKKYFKYTALDDIVLRYPYSSSLKGDALQAEKDARVAFLDFLKGVLNVDYRSRWTPSQALHHPFITGAPFDPSAPFQPPPPLSPPSSPRTPQKQQSSSSSGLPRTPEAAKLSSPLVSQNSILAMHALGTSPSASMMSKLTSSMQGIKLNNALSSSAPSNNAPSIPTSSQLFASAPSSSGVDPGALLGISPSAGPSHIRTDTSSHISSIPLPTSIPLSDASMVTLGASPSQKSPFFGQHFVTTSSSQSSLSGSQGKTQSTKSPASKNQDDEDIFEFE